jgi:hypothetical protein
MIYFESSLSLMQGTERALESKFESWSTHAVALTIEYPVEVMEEIRVAVFDGLRQLGHGGLEVGGVLFGARRTDSIRLLTWRPILCEHAQGPSFLLSPRDRVGLERVVELAKSDPDLKGLQPLGWFLSHARSDIFLTTSDLEIYNDFFPEPWQVTLVLRPTSSGNTRAGFFLREADGSLRLESSYREFAIEPLQRLGDASFCELPVASPPVASPPIPYVRREPNGGSVRANAEPVDVAEPPPLQIQERASAKGRWFWIVPVCLALLLAGVLIKERYVAPREGLFYFRVHDGGDTVHIEWDKNSPLIRASGLAVLDIKDGSATKRYALTEDQLHEGNLTYARSSGDVELRMVVYPGSRAGVQEFARLISPHGTPSVSPASPSSVPPDAIGLRAERDQLEDRVKQLNAELGKQVARASQLQGVVRILQNRIAVEASRNSSPDIKTTK